MFKIIFPNLPIGLPLSFLYRLYNYILYFVNLFILFFDFILIYFLYMFIYTFFLLKSKLY